MARQTALTAALFVRIPQAQARALDRLAFESAAPQAGGRLRDARPLHRAVADRRLRSCPPRSRPELGWHSFRASAPEVLTLEGVAELLEVEPELVAALAEQGRCRAGVIGVEWRFARAAVLAWLAQGPMPDTADG